jgi:hypothetical protein
MTDQYRDLLQVIHGRAGDAFRAAFRYGPDDWTMLYVRDDVATDQLRGSLPTIVQRAREYEPAVEPGGYPVVGETQATVELYDGAVILHFQTGTDTGIVVSLDREVAQGLGQFVNQINAVLADEE